MWRTIRGKKNKHISLFTIILGFLAVILTGSLCLMLPFATQDGNGASFMDSLFTSTSAVCVTRLILHDTATYWSSFGQAVILFLIQIGGLGVVTISVLVAIISGKKISLMQRSTMSEAIAVPHVGGIIRMTEFILKTVLIIEVVGALLNVPLFSGFWFVEGNLVCHVSFYLSLLQCRI